ncbi:hypothetical protein QQF64_031239 [Cirrhinus molitorella]|uniref:Gypsy retrotransposon integrase-like protein 1 n=1 Tax=Cirrhinus molitorella TaxID=172907 RepID=A0ABR3MWG6_9TELE
MLKRCFLGKRVIAALLFCFVLLLYRQACRSRTQRRSGRPAGEDTYESLLHRHERHYLHQTRNLTRLISQLKAELQERSRQLQRSAVIFPLEHEEQNQSELEEFMRKQLRKAEFFTGEPQVNEFALLPFETFTLRQVYQLESGLTRLPVESPFRQDRRNELNGALEAGLHLLNQPQLRDPQQRRIYSPQHFYEALIPEILSHVHGHPSVGHYGLAKTLDRAMRSFYWPYMSSDIAKHCSQCKDCQSQHSPVLQSQAPLIPISPDRPFQIVAADITELPISTKATDFRDKAQDQQCLNYDCHLKYTPYGIGDLVLVDDPAHCHNKLYSCWVGPYEVFRSICPFGSSTPVNFEVQDASRPHVKTKIIHYNRMKPYITDPKNSHTLIPPSSPVQPNTLNTLSGLLPPHVTPVFPGLPTPQVQVEQPPLPQLQPHPLLQLPGALQPSCPMENVQGLDSGLLLPEMGTPQAIQSRGVSESPDTPVSTRDVLPRTRQLPTHLKDFALY